MNETQIDITAISGIFVSISRKLQKIWLRLLHCVSKK